MKRFYQVMIVLLISLSLWFSPSQIVQAATNSTEMNIYGMYLDSDDKGDSVLVESKGEYLLIDFGLSSHVPAILKQLKALKVTHVSLLFSHLHVDHIGGSSADMLFGLEMLVDSGIQIDTLYLPDKSVAPYSINYPAKYEKIEGFMEDKTQITYLSLGSQFQFGDVSAEVIGPVNSLTMRPSLSSSGDGTIDYTSYENNCSLAMILTCGSTRYFTAGDCYQAEADSLVATYGDALNCDIMKICHHGTGSGNTAALIAAISPSYSFASNTGRAGKNTTLNRWTVYSALNKCSKYGICYLVGNEQETIIYHVKNNVITLYRGSKVKNANKMTGWQHLYGADGTNMLYNTYYLDDKTLPVTGVQKIGKNYYYFNSVGLMQHGSFTSDGEYDAWVTNSTGTRYYTLSANRKYSYLSVGFQEIGEDLYYFSKSGYLQRCTSQNSNEDYAIKLIDLDYYAIDREGRVVRGTWMNLDGADCYFNSEGKMCTDGTHKVDGSYYLFNYDGSLIRGESEEPQLVTYDGNQYLVDNNGIVVTDTLLPFGSYKCYFDSRGKMAQDEVVTIGGKKYYFNVNGYMVRGRAAWIDGKRYYFNKNGTMRINGTVIWKNYKFRCGPDGVMTKIRKVK